MKGLFQCPPWARSFWAFSPYLNHMRNFSYLFLLKSFLCLQFCIAAREFLLVLSVYCLVMEEYSAEE